MIGFSSDCNRPASAQASAQGTAGTWGSPLPALPSSCSATPACSSALASAPRAARAGALPSVSLSTTLKTADQQFSS